MLKLTIKYSYGNWYAMPLTQQQDYKFAGSTAQQQSVQVRALQQAMINGSPTVINGVPRFFSNVTAQDAPEVVRQLFRTTDALYYETNLVYLANENQGATLLSDIVDAGRALALFLPKLEEGQD